MDTKINIYLSFNGRCREAMTFYKECFGGELTFQTFEGSPMESLSPNGNKQLILHSTLINNNLIIMATDLVHGQFNHVNNFSLFVTCNRENEIKDLYSKLSQGGETIDSLKLQFWGALFGELIDKFGIRWKLNYEISKHG